MTHIRTRFAPSPTGDLHVGGARTALYSWLYARHHKGDFILRIEDTDTERSTQKSIDAIIEAMQWLGLNHDEDIYFQSKRFDRYAEVANQLLESGHAYRCTCSKERLEKLRETQTKNHQKPRYDGQCRDAKVTADQKPFVIRFANPTEGEVSFHDEVYGDIIVKNSELDDFVMVRSDSIPTYNFSVVVDDWDMQITHVIRGDDHVNNTPKQINLIAALGATQPIYVHLPMILGKDGKRLSKRHGAVGVMQYHQDGFLKEALLNHLVRLGWSHGDKEIFSIDEMIHLFDFTHIHRGAAIFDTEKLVWLNHYYIKELAPTDLVEGLQWHLEQADLDINNGPALENVIAAQAERCKTLIEMADKSHYFYTDVHQYDEKACQKFLNKDIVPVLQNIAHELTNLQDWNKEAIHDVMIQAAEAADLKLGKVAQPIRIALTGSTISPSIDMTICLIGQEKTIQRLERLIEYISTT